jgi:delta 1-pyrroline-5-carboxylate dehydrogenase
VPEICKSASITKKTRISVPINTRVDATARYIASRVRAGNVYVNRNMIGAVVGVQPFGGRGLSGTGPKAVVGSICAASQPSRP